MNERSFGKEKIVMIVAGGSVPLPFLQEAYGRMHPVAVIAADRGLEACVAVGIPVDEVIGDFDSLDPAVRENFLSDEQNVTKLNPIKNDTDTEAALQLAFERYEGSIYILGGTGSRVDHMLGNVALLGQGFAHGREVYLLDPCNRVRLVKDCCHIKRDAQYGKFLSVISFCGTAHGVSEQGVFYPVDRMELSPYTSLGISNEITEDEAVISVEDGVLIVVESRDGC